MFCNRGVRDLADCDFAPTMKKYLFSGIKGKRCAFCHRPILTREMLRINVSGCEEWVHIGCFKFLVTGHSKFRKPVKKKSRVPKFVWVGLIGFTVLYASALLLH